MIWQVRNPGDKSGVNPGDKSGENQGGKSGVNPGDKSGESPGDKPVRLQVISEVWHKTRCRVRSQELVPGEPSAYHATWRQQRRDVSRPHYGTGSQPICIH